MDLLQRLNKVASDFGLGGASDAMLAIAACVLLNDKNEVVLDGRDLPGTLARINDSLSAAEKKTALDALASGTASAVPVCRKFSVTLAQIKALGAVAVGTIDIAELTDAVIFDFAIEASGFTGPSLTVAEAQLTADLGGFGPSVDGIVGERADNDLGSDVNVLPVNVRGQTLAIWINLTGCNASALTGGTVTAWVTYLERP